MLRKLFFLFFLASSILCADEVKKVSENILFIDYKVLDHYFNLTQFRAGNHDVSGNNKYSFSVNYVGLLNSPEETEKKDLSSKKTVVHEGGEIWNLNIDALKLWKPSDNEKQRFTFIIQGDVIRQLIAEVMVKYQVQEKDVGVQIDIILSVNKKKFYFLNEKKEIIRVTYYPVPLNMLTTKTRIDEELTMQDETGLLAKINVKYGSLEKKK